MPRKSKPSVKTSSNLDEFSHHPHSMGLISNLQRDINEKEILLSLNSDIAAIRDRKNLLTLIQPKLKMLFNTEDIFICRLDPERRTLNPFLRVAGPKRREDPDYGKLLDQYFPIEDEFIANLVDSRSPVNYNIDKFTQSTHAPEYLKVLQSTGLATSLSRTLRNDTNVIGVLTLWSERGSSFSPHHLKLVDQVADQISIAVTNIIAYEHIQARENEKDILLSVSRELASIRDKEDLLPILKKQLERLSFYSDLVITKVDDNMKTFSAFLINEDSNRLLHPGYREMANARHIFPDGVYEVALYSESPVVYNLHEVASLPDACSYVKFVYENGTVEMVGISLRDRNKEIGVLFLFSDRAFGFTKHQFSLAQGIGNQLASVVANLLANEEIKRRENEKSILLSFSTDIAAVRDKKDLLHLIKRRLHDLFSISGFGIALINEDATTYSAFLVEVEEKYRKHPDFEDAAMQKYTIADGVFHRVMNSDDPTIIDVGDLPDNPHSLAYIRFWKKVKIPFIVGAALRVSGRDLGCLLFHGDPYLVDRLNHNLLKGVCSQISIALSNILANSKVVDQLVLINRYKEQLEKEKLYLQEEISSGYIYADIIGVSPEMQKVFESLNRVAPSNSTVLILGETGTGKELIARAIHNSSPRKDKLMVKVNCAAIPVHLLESELFGHEKGSFTGAFERRIGKFELANNGTLFLDEIGELPPGMQAKLLRAIQEKEIERIGGKGVIKINIRLIAATNRHLQKEIDEGRFRQDLYYRLNVFPISLPALRERKEDIPKLVEHFIEKYSKNTGRNVKHISSKAMKALLAYSWPGNIRELEHLIERTVLTSKGDTINEIQLPTSSRKSMKKILQDDFLQTHEENERDHIIRVLNKCGGKIYGAGGAAEILNLQVSTLNSKMKKLGIKRNRMFN